MCNLHDGFWVQRSHSVPALPPHLPRGLHWPLADAVLHLSLLHGAGGCSLALVVWNQLSSPVTAARRVKVTRTSSARSILEVYTDRQSEVALRRCLRMLPDGDSWWEGFIWPFGNSFAFFSRMMCQINLDECCKCSKISLEIISTVLTLSCFGLYGNWIPRCQCSLLPLFRCT